MKRLGVIALAAALVAALADVLVGRYAAPERIYTAAEVKAGLQGQPGQWVGRAVLVRGVVSGVNSTSTCTLMAGGVGSACTPQQSWVTIGAIGSAVRVPSYSIRLPIISQLSITAMSRAAVGVHPLTGHPITGSARLFPARGPSLHWGPVTRIFVYSPNSMEELTVSVQPGAYPPVAGLVRALPDGLYTLPAVGPLVSRLFPRDGSGVYRVRLLDPCMCAQTPQPPCADAVFVH
jgi:hypothetical protein